MNKNVQTYYAIVSVEAGLPKDKRRSLIVKYGSTGAFGTLRLSEFEQWKVTHYLSEQQGVVLSVEEWEKVQKCIDVLQEINDGDCTNPYSSNYIGSSMSIKVEQALSQLNTKP